MSLGEAFRKKTSGYNEFGTKGGRVYDLNHHFKQLWNSEKGGGAKLKRNPYSAEN